MHNIPQTRSHKLESVIKKKKKRMRNRRHSTHRNQGCRDQESPICQLRLGVSSGKLFFISSPRKQRRSSPRSHGTSVRVCVSVCDFLLKKTTVQTDLLFAECDHVLNLQSSGRGLVCFQYVVQHTLQAQRRLALPAPTSPMRTSRVPGSPPHIIPVSRRLILQLNSLIHYMLHRLSEPYYDQGKWCVILQKF